MAMSSAGSSSIIENLKDRHRITDAQLNLVIEESDMACLAQHFGNNGILACMMRLSEAETTEVRSATCYREGTLKCLQFWKKKNPLQATYRALLSIVLSLEEGEIAEHICQYLSESSSQQYQCDFTINGYRQKRCYDVYTAKVIKFLFLL